MPPSAPIPAVTVAGSALGADVWKLELDAVPTEALALLSSAERERGAGFARDVERRRFEAAHAALRLVLGAYRDFPPAALDIVRSERGKPSLPGGPTFSIARSAGVALLAVHPSSEVGVDIERLREIAEVAGVAKRLLTAEERQAWSAAGGDATAFLRIWTRREAALKALGLSLAPAEGLAAVMERTPVEIDEIVLVPGHAAAVATLGAAS